MRTELACFLQIIFESLPVSSSGNLELMGLSLPESFNYATHAVTLLVYVVFFRKKWIPIIIHPLRVRTQIMTALFYGIAALVPTCAAYFLLAYVPVHVPLWLGFCVTTLILFLPIPARGECPRPSIRSFGSLRVSGCIEPYYFR